MQKYNGFTLIELLVVTSLIAILSVVGFASFQGIRAKAQDAKVKSDLNAIKKAYEANYDPAANGGQGGYKKLSPTNDNNSPYFASGKIPTPDGGGSYLVPVTANPIDNSLPNFVITAPKAGTPATADICTATPSNTNCNTVISTQGTPVNLASIGGVPPGPFTNLYNDSDNFWVTDSGNWSGAGEASIPDTRRKTILVTNNVSTPVHSGTGSVKLAVSPVSSGCCSAITARHDYPTNWAAYKWLTFWWYGKNTGATIDFVIQQEMLIHGIAVLTAVLMMIS